MGFVEQMDRSIPFAKWAQRGGGPHFADSSGRQLNFLMWWPGGRLSSGNGTLRKAGLQKRETQDADRGARRYTGQMTKINPSRKLLRVGHSGWKIQEGGSEIRPCSVKSLHHFE